MLHQILEQSEINNSLFGTGNKQLVNSRTLTGNVTIGAADPNYMVLDPNGADRTVTLPAVAKGLFFQFSNAADAAESLTIKNSGGTTIASIGRGGTATFFSDGTTWYSSGNGAAAYSGIVNVTAATLALTHEEHAGRTITLNRAAGITVTLPAALGTGNVFRFLIGTTITSNNYVFNRAGSDTICGVSIDDDGDGEPANGWGATAATAITLGGTSNATGGTKGGELVLTDMAAALWHARHIDVQGGTEATPFS